MNFVLPDFTRTAWVSGEANRIWGPRLQRISDAWNEICWQSVAAGIRRAFITSLSLDACVKECRRWSEHRLAILPLTLEGHASYTYSATPPPPQQGNTPRLRIGVASPEDLYELGRAWDNRDDDTIGALLGYPACCRSFFRRVWVDHSCVDTTWAMATNTKAVERDVTSVEISMDGPPFANILWRWIGVRAVPHLPCQFNCPDSIRIGKDMLAIGRKIGCGEEMDWIEEILSWSVEWSALHGVAEILTPIVKVSTTTDSTGVIHIVRWKGRTFPREGAQGLRFPYSSPSKMQMKPSAPRRRDNRELLQPLSATMLPEWYNRDNGFATRYAMNRAHDPIVKLAHATLGNAGGSILDLGCGNGALLAKIVKQVPRAIPFGVDLNTSAIEHASEVFPTLNCNFSVGNLFDVDCWAVDRKYELVILMVGRLLEAPPDSAQRVVDALLRCASNALVYVYSGWSSESLPTIVARANLRLAQPSENNCGLLDLN